MNDAFCMFSEYLVEVIFLSLLVGDYENVFYEEPTWNRNFLKEMLLGPGTSEPLLKINVF